MEKEIHKIWDGTAEIEVPGDFKEATIGEIRKVYGMKKPVPEYMVIDREKHVFISAVSAEEPDGEEEEKDIAKLAQVFGHALMRTVPGYRCMGIYRKQIDQKEACAIQYTSYALEDNIYTMLLLVRGKKKVDMLNCVCSNAQVPRMHPVFCEVIDSLKFRD